MSKAKYISGCLAIVLVSLLCNSGFAQKGVSSPYSIYGIGNIHETGFYRNMGMGGLSLALSEVDAVNISNPASYTAFKQNSFVFDLGGQTTGLTLNTADTNQTTYNTSLAYVTFGFPVTKMWGSSFGIRPFSVVNYKATSVETIANVGDASYIYEGTGGINEVYWGNAIKFGGLSIGGNVSYLFGPLSKTKSEIFTLGNTFHYYTSEKINIGGAYFKGGVQYKHVIDTVKGRELKNALTFIAGGTMDFQTNLRARRTTLGVTFDDYLLDPFLILPKDTLMNVTDTGSLSLPGGYGVGVSFGYGTKLLVGFDYYSKSWSDFKVFDVQDSLGDYSRMVFGLQFTPDAKSTNYFKSMQYRVGLHQENTFLVFRGQQLTKSGISFGLGLPLKRIGSINLAFEMGSKGTTNDSLIKENYWIAGFGLTLTDFWFQKRKYN